MRRGPAQESTRQNMAGTSAAWQPSLHSLRLVRCTQHGRNVLDRPQQLGLGHPQSSRSLLSKGCLIVTCLSAMHQPQCDNRGLLQANAAELLCRSRSSPWLWQSQQDDPQSPEANPVENAGRDETMSSYSTRQHVQQSIRNGFFDVLSFWTGQTKPGRHRLVCRHELTGRSSLCRWRISSVSNDCKLRSSCRIL